MKRYSTLLATSLLTGLVLSSCSMGSLIGNPSDRGQLHLELIRPSEGLLTFDQVLVIPLDGFVATGDMNTYWGQPGMLVALKDRLDAARKNHRLRAVVLRMNSPGGSVTASDLIHREIKRFREETNLPVVVQMTDVAASGGLYIAMAADEIYALPTTVTGSIGVIAQMPRLDGLGDKIGVQMRMIKSAPMKDAGSPWRSLNEKEREIFQRLIDHFDEQFVNVILESRGEHGLSRQKLTALADGRILRSEEAATAGLIDGVKYPEEVFDRAAQMGGVDDYNLVSYEYPRDFRGNIYARAPNATACDQTGQSLIRLEIGRFDPHMQQPRFLYLWAP